jgi:dihydrofolate reductase
MSKIVVTNSLTLDGVMQSPSGTDEDVRGGFAQGGWAPPYVDEVLGAYMARGVQEGGSLLLGRRTYETFASFWPHAPADNPFTEVINGRQKYVASRTLEAPLEWRNSTLLEGDAADGVAALRAEPGPDVVILGSGELIRSLMARDLIDEWVLPIHPLVLGSGRRLFADGTPGATLELVDATPTTTGVIIARYRPA